jgi:hypothetical protein
MDCHEQAEARREVEDTGMMVESLLYFFESKGGKYLLYIYTRFLQNPKT